MTVTTSSHIRSIPASGALVALGWGRWRVLSATGAVAGLVEERTTTDGARFRALRYRWSERGFVEVGEFWRLDDAAAVLRSA